MLIAPGLILLLWLAVRCMVGLARNALALFMALAAGIMAYRSGAGGPGALVVGIAAAAASLFAVRTLAASRSPLVRLLATALFVVPAAFAGYQLSYAIAGIGAPSDAWRQVLAITGAGLIAATAWLPMRTAPPARPQGGTANGSKLGARSARHLATNDN